MRILNFIKVIFRKILLLFWFFYMIPTFFYKAKKKNNHVYFNTKDLFIVTSCLNPHDSNLFFNHNFKHTKKQRFIEFQKSIKSIRNYYPNAQIVSLDNSRIGKVIKEKVQSLVDARFDYSQDPIILKTRKNPNKGVPWAAKLIKFLSENCELIHAKRIHFFVGRYFLTKKKNINYRKKGIFFKYYRQHKNVSTRYFFSNQINIRNLINILKKTYLHACLGRSVEDSIFKNCNKIKLYLVDKIGVSGTVNGVNYVEE
jgi:hypothetical protein